MRAAIEPAELRTTPKNWPGSGVTTVDAAQRRALVLRTGNAILWDLETLDVQEGPFVALHPTGVVRVHDATRWALADATSPEARQLVPAGTVSFSPFDPWATRRLDVELDPSATPPRGVKTTVKLVDLARDTVREIEAQATLGAFLPGGRLVLVDASGRIDVWDLATGKLAKKLGTLKRKPELLRVDRTGERLLVYGKDKKFSSVLRVWDTTSYALLTDREMPWVRFGHHVGFDDGRHLVGDVAMWDVDADRAHELWLGVYYGAPHVASMLRAPDGKMVAVLCSRDRMDIRRHLELWDVERRVRVGALELPTRRPSIVARAGESSLALLHSVGGRPIYDDREDPALSSYRVALDAAAPDPDQPEPGSHFFERV